MVYIQEHFFDSYGLEVLFIFMLDFWISSSVNLCPAFPGDFFPFLID